MNPDIPAAEAQKPPTGAPDPASVTILDQVLWRDLASAVDEQRFGESWLELLCRMVPGAAAAVLALDRGSGNLTPIARFPRNATANTELLAAAQTALTERRGTLQAPSASAPQQPTRLAYPILLDEQVVGVVALELAPGSARDPRQPMRQVQWAVAWVRDFLRTPLAFARSDSSSKGIARKSGTSCRTISRVAISGFPPRPIS